MRILERQSAYLIVPNYLQYHDFSGFWTVFAFEYGSRWVSHWKRLRFLHTEQSCFVLGCPLTVHWAFKLMVQEQIHSMRLRSSVIRTVIRWRQTSCLKWSHLQRGPYSGAGRGGSSVCLHRCKEAWLRWLGTLCKLPGLHVYSHTFDLYVFHVKNLLKTNWHRSLFQKLITSRKILVHHLMIQYQILGVVKVLFLSLVWLWKTRILSLIFFGGY